MNLGKSVLLCGMVVFALSIADQTFAQVLAPTLNHTKYIVKLKNSPKISPQSAFAGFKGLQVNAQKLSPQLGLVSLDFTGKSIPANLLQELRKNPLVEYAQENHPVTRRTSDSEIRTPNDLQHTNQWNFNGLFPAADIFALQAWNIATGGKDLRDNDIAVAVVDGGVDFNHEDLKNNMWVNPNEIPANDIDDDLNGYVDDVNGFNPVDGKPVTAFNSHGTHVAGIIGAEGNNTTGLSGVNWNVKIVTVQVFGASSFDTEDVVKAYGYVIALKKQWLESGGKSGANIVATNSSFGMDNADCKSGDYPVWDDLYNQMGELGILSAAATANFTTDVDVDGDVPTGCTSEYLITVTNTDSTGKKVPYAGYGKTTIDLGAPGTNILSTTPRNTYQSKTGTSMATPHVAGATAFLMSVASPHFLYHYYYTPGAAVLSLKKILLDTATPQEDLKEATVSGGRLNLLTSAQAISNF